MASVVGAGLLILAVPALIWQLEAPYPGFTLTFSTDDRAVVKTVEASGTAASVGVESGDTLVSVGGVRPSEELPVGDRGPAFRLDLTNRYREGERADWVVARDGGRRTLVGPFEGFPDSRAVSRAIVLGAFWLIGWFLLWARSDRQSVRHLAYTIFGLTASVLFVLNSRMAVDTSLGFAVNQAHILGLTLGPAFLIHFGVIFPVQTLSDRVRRRVLVATYGLYILAVFSVYQVVFVHALLRPEAPYLILPAVLETLHYPAVSVWLHVGDFLVCGLLMLWTYRHLENDRQRDRVKWILWAVLLTAGIDGLGMGAALYADAISFGDLYPYRNYLYLVIAAGLVFAVFRHDLFDVDAVIRGTVAYFGTTSLLFAVFAATEALISEALKEMLPTRSGALGTASAAVLAGALFQPIRTWLKSKMLEVLPVDPEEEVLGSGR